MREVNQSYISGVGRCWRWSVVVLHDAEADQNALACIRQAGAYRVCHTFSKIRFYT